MKKKREILKDYTNKLKQFKKYNKAYFEDDNPIISDAKYDALKSELINLEKNYKTRTASLSRFNSILEKASGRKVTFPRISLSPITSPRPQP